MNASDTPLAGDGNIHDTAMEEDIVMQDDPASVDPPIGTFGADKDSLGIQDLSLPRTLIQRLAKGALPPQTQLQKDALLAISKSTTVFINMLASDAAALAAFNGKKTVQPLDVLAAIERLEFPAFAPRMQSELEAYQRVKSGKRSIYREKVKERENAQAHGKSDKPGSIARVVNGHGGDDEGNDEAAEEEHEMADDAPGLGVKNRSQRLGERPGDGDKGDIGGEPAAKKRRNGLNGAPSAVPSGDYDYDDEMVDAEEEDEDDPEGDDDEDGDGDGDDPEDETLEDEEDEEAAMHRVDDLDNDRLPSTKRGGSLATSRTGLVYGARDGDVGADEDDEDED